MGLPAAGNENRCPTRSDILEIIQNYPGVSPIEVARQLALDHSTVTYHARILERSGHVKVEKRGKRVSLCTANSQRCEHVMKAIEVLKHERHRELAELLRVERTLTTRQVMDALSVSDFTARKYSFALEALGMVLVTRSRRCALRMTWSTQGDQLLRAISEKDASCPRCSSAGVDLAASRGGIDPVARPPVTPLLWAATLVR